MIKSEQYSRQLHLAICGKNLSQQGFLGNSLTGSKPSRRSTITQEGQENESIKKKGVKKLKKIPRVVVHFLCMPK